MKKDLKQAGTLSLRLLKANAQYVILTDVSFYAAGYILMIEDYITDQSRKTYRTYVPVSFGSKIFTPTYLKLSIYAKEFWQYTSRLIILHTSFGVALSQC